MNTYITKRQVREINRKLFANDLIYNSDDNQAMTDVIALIMQRYDPKDKLENVPSILEVKKIDRKTLDNILLLNRKSVIIQVNNSLLSDKAMLSAMQQLKKLKYKIIVELNRDDTQFTIATILADILRMDINNIPDVLISSATHLGYNGKVLICNIDSPSDYEAASAIHADLFEGSYITEGTNISFETIESRAPVNYIEVMQILKNGGNDIKRLSKAISKDVIMTAQIIRLANLDGVDRVHSIEQAIGKIGISTLKKWVYLLQFNRKGNNSNNELLQLAYCRALFCEKVILKARRTTLKSNDAYLIGLFSTLDAILGKSVDKQIKAMGMNEVTEDALIYREGEGGILLNLIKAYEEANWIRVERYSTILGLTKNELSDIYYKCVNEVAEFWKNLTTVEIGQ